jgi:hypothetical protein
MAFLFGRNKSKLDGLPRVANDLLLRCRDEKQRAKVSENHPLVAPKLMPIDRSRMSL